MVFVMPSGSITVMLSSSLKKTAFGVHIVSFGVHIVSFGVHIVSFGVHIVSFVVHIVSFKLILGRLALLRTSSLIRSLAYSQHVGSR